MLQLGHRFGVEEVVLPVAPPLILAAHVEIALGNRPVGNACGGDADLFGNRVNSDAFDPEAVWVK